MANRTKGPTNGCYVLRRRLPRLFVRLLLFLLSVLLCFLLRGLLVTLAGFESYCGLAEYEAASDDDTSWRCCDCSGFIGPEVLD